jgi:hypothetical protein
MLQQDREQSRRPGILRVAVAAATASRQPRPKLAMHALGGRRAEQAEGIESFA